jgi:FAD/FMN-containing dehydrogenase
MSGTDALLLDTLRRIVGDAQVLTEGDLSGYELDWRKRHRGRSLAVVRPGSTAEVAAVMRACAAAGTSVVPQGGNTGLVCGGVPDASGRQVLLSLQRLNRLRHLDADNLTLTVEAGCVLQAVPWPAVPAEPGLRGQLHHRRQPVHQRRRHAGAALRQCP